MKKVLKVHHFLLVLAFLIMEACGPDNEARPHQEPSAQQTDPVASGFRPSPTLTVSPAPSSTATAVPSQTPTQTLSPTATIPPPTPVPAISIEPLTRGSDIRIDSWSPDGQWLGFWLWTEDDKAAGLGPPGKLIFFNPYTDEMCEYADLVFSEYGYQIYWQPDGRAAINHTEAYWIGFPCQDFVPIRFEAIAMLESHENQSPDGTFRAETKLLDSQDGWLTYATTITNNTTGGEENRVNWEIDERLGIPDNFLGGKWITDDLFLIYESRDQGPVLIQAGGEAIQVAPDLFGVEVPVFPRDSWDWYSLRAFAARVEDEDHYHLLLHGIGGEAQFPQVRLFHSESGMVETLPYKDLWHPGLTPDGRWVLMDSHPIIRGNESYALTIRPVDPPESAMRLFADGTYIAAWSPALSEIAFGWAGRFTVFQFPDGEAVSTWTTGKYSVGKLVWSPTGEFLAATGGIPETYADAIFVVQVME